MQYDKSRYLYDIAKRRMPGGVNSANRAVELPTGSELPAALFIERGDGCMALDVDGNRYVDYHMSSGALIHGHRNESVVAAIQDQVERGLCFSWSHELEGRVASLIGMMIPSIEKLRFCNSGSEAVVAAISLARQYTNRSQIIMFDECYHGWIVPHLQGFVALSFGDIDLVRQYVAKHSSRVAAIILEPWPASGGLIEPNRAYLHALRHLCDDYGVPLIFDEVITGMRLGPSGAQGHFGVEPDLTVLGKVLGGGMPLGVYGGRAQLMDIVAPLGAFKQGGTYPGHPLSLSAAYAVLESLIADPPYERLESAGKKLKEALEQEARGVGVSLQISQAGSILTPYLAPGNPTSAANRRELAIAPDASLYRLLLAEGVLIASGPTKSWYLSESHNESAIELTVRAFGAALGRLAA